MCRLFGFRSSIVSQVHTSLIGAENALMSQSPRHPDGWGVSYYLADAPHVIRSTAQALNDQLFRKVSGLVSSQTVIAHLRKATFGELGVLNTHPFQFGHWTFAHNGNIKGFSEVKEALLSSVDPELASFLFGDTDSEVFFFLILSELKKVTDIESRDLSLDVLVEASQKAVERVISLVGPLSDRDDGPASDSYVSFIITNGQVFLGHQGGKHLYYSTYKSRCPDRDHCAFFQRNCEGPADPGERVNHLIFTSEPLQTDNIWLPMDFMSMIGVDRDMRLQVIPGSSDSS